MAPSDFSVVLDSQSEWNCCQIGSVIGTNTYMVSSGKSRADVFFHGRNEHIPAFKQHQVSMPLVSGLRNKVSNRYGDEKPHLSVQEVVGHEVDVLYSVAVCHRDVPPPWLQVFYLLTKQQMSNQNQRSHPYIHVCCGQHLYRTINESQIECNYKSSTPESQVN